MAIARNPEQKEDDPEDKSSSARPPWETKHDPKQFRDQRLACILNTEVGAVLAVIRQNQDPTSHLSPEDGYASPLIHSLKSLRASIFGPQQEWNRIDPTAYLSPFLDIIQSEEVPAAVTGVTLSALLKILKLDMFDENTPGARDGIKSVVQGISKCCLEKTDSLSEDAVMMSILQVLMAVMKNPASVLLDDHDVFIVVSICNNFVQQSNYIVQQSNYAVQHLAATRGDLLQRHARHTMHELIQVIFARLPQVEASREDDTLESDLEDGDVMTSGYGALCIVNIFRRLCSLLNLVVDGEGVTLSSDENVMLFALTSINSAIELGGQSIEKHPKLLRMIQNDLFHHFIHYGICSSPLVLSMICSTVLNLYLFLRRHLRLQIEAFFTYVLFKVAANYNAPPLQDVAIEGMINFCRQPNFPVEAFVNYDCDPICRNIFEETMKLLCRTAYPKRSPSDHTQFQPLSHIQVQAFEGLVAVIYSLADNMNTEKEMDLGPAQTELTEYWPFWVEKCDNFEDLDTWVEFMRRRKLQKRKIMIAANHFNRDEKKAMDFLKISHILPDPPDAKTLAHFYRYTPGLDKNKIGDFLGDPDEFNLEVLKEHSHTFDFSGMNLDTALRTYLETFRLPGEAQKIHRILEAFTDAFYELQDDKLFACKDAVLVICYSIIILNTDLHNPQVKKKMTEEAFISNNRGLNGKKDFPRELLSELFYSISNNPIIVNFEQNGGIPETNPNRGMELIQRSNRVDPFMLCNFEPRICREMFGAISGPTIGVICAIFQHAVEVETLQECMEGLLSVARIARHGLEEIIDELLACLSKIVATLLNPAYIHQVADYDDLKLRMATLSMLSIANQFGDVIREGWGNVVDCMLKVIKKSKLLSQTESTDPDSASGTCNDLKHSSSDSGIIFPSSLNSGFPSGHRIISSATSRLSQFLSMDGMEDVLFEHNSKTTDQQCWISSIFAQSCNYSAKSLQDLGQVLIFAAACQGQKCTTHIQEEEKAGFCWELITIVATANIHRFPVFWPSFHEYLIVAFQPPLSCAFQEKAIKALFKICFILLSSNQSEALSENLIFRSISLVSKMDNDVKEICCEAISESLSKIFKKCPQNIQTQIGWNYLLGALTYTARHELTFDAGVESLISLLSEENNLNKLNYAHIVDTAFSFAKMCSPETSIKIVDLVAVSVNVLLQWHRTGYSDPGSNASNLSSSSTEDWPRANTSQYSPHAMFLRVATVLMDICIGCREEIVTNHSIAALQKIFGLSEELGMTCTSCTPYFNNVLFPLIDELHEKMKKYSHRPKSEETDIMTSSLEGTLFLAIKLLAEVFIQFLRPLAEGSEFRNFWQSGILRRMDSCMKIDLGYKTRLQELVPELLKLMITVMMEKNVLERKVGDELWDITYLQIQWIAPSVKDDLFPED